MKKQNKVIRLSLLTVVVTFFLIPVAVVANEEASLPSLNIDSEGISLSGVSSGGYMAVQYHIAHSKNISGVGVIAGGPYNCAFNSLTKGLRRCMGKNGRPDIGAGNFINFTHKMAAEGLIDNTDNLQNDKVWIFHGKRDKVVKEPISDALNEYYSNLVNIGNVEYVNNIDAPHGMITDNTNDPCDDSAHPWINNCGYDSAGVLLKHLYGPLNERTSNIGSLVKFSQAEFATNSTLNTLAKNGFVYIPKACSEGERCRLHVAFHGCLQGESFIGKKYVSDSGYNQWAEANNIVLLYPQAKASHSPFNPNGCWDWWGYTGGHYIDKTGAQISQVHNMVKAIANLEE